MFQRPLIGIGVALGVKRLVKPGTPKRLSRDALESSPACLGSSGGSEAVCERSARQCMVSMEREAFLRILV